MTKYTILTKKDPRSLSGLSPLRSSPISVFVGDKKEMEELAREFRKLYLDEEPGTHPIYLVTDINSNVSKSAYRRLEDSNSAENVKWM